MGVKLGSSLYGKNIRLKVFENGDKMRWAERRV
jgi:hypothetical protein